MRIVNLKKKIGAALLAAGMITPGAAYAAGIGVNLLVDPSFEDDVAAGGVEGVFGSRALTSWSDGSLIGYSYRYDQGFDRPGIFANDPLLNPPAPGLTYFAANFTGDPLDIDASAPGEVMQRVDVSSGDSAAAIAAGQAEYLLSGYFGAYSSTATDTVTLYLDFLNIGGSSLGTASLEGGGPDWNLQDASGPIPVGTTMVEVSVFETVEANNGLVYMDLANFAINQVPEPSSVLLAGLGIVGMGILRRKQKS